MKTYLLTDEACGVVYGRGDTKQEAEGDALAHGVDIAGDGLEMIESDKPRPPNYEDWDGQDLFGYFCTECFYDM